MRKGILLVIVIMMTTLVVKAQVPYFARSPKSGKLYGYTSVKFRPGINSIETYNTFQYGATDYVAGGIDFYTGPDSAYMGFMIRAGYKFNQWFGIGGTVTPSFSLNNNFKYDYCTAGLFMNGSLTKDAHLFWCTNTWLGLNSNSSYTLRQYTYLGYEFTMKNGDSITPMIGLDHSWKFNEKSDIAAGFYYTHKVWNFYVWVNDFLKENPRLVVGIDFTF